MLTQWMNHLHSNDRSTFFVNKRCVDADVIVSVRVVIDVVEVLLLVVLVLVLVLLIVY